MDRHGIKRRPLTSSGIVNHKTSLAPKQKRPLTSRSPAKRSMAEQRRISLVAKKAAAARQMREARNKMRADKVCAYVSCQCPICGE